jgi:hypothetical protein
MPSKISEPEITSLWNMTLKSLDWVNFLWQFHVVVTGVAIGWLFSGAKSLDNQQKFIITVIYSLAYLVNLGATVRAYMILFPTLRQFKTSTNDLEGYNEDFKKMLQNLPGKYHWGAGLFLHVGSYMIVLYCIWHLVKT